MNPLLPVIIIPTFLKAAAKEGELQPFLTLCLLISPKTKLDYNSFESLVLSLLHPTWKTSQPLLFVIVLRASGLYSEFVSEFSEFPVSSLVLKSDKVIIAGDFNIHADIDNDSLATAFISLLDSIGFSQGVHKPTHCFNHTLDLVLTYGIEIDSLTVFPQNPSLSDHYLITFDFFLLNLYATQQQLLY